MNVNITETWLIQGNQRKFTWEKIYLRFKREGGWEIENEERYIKQMKKQTMFHRLKESPVEHGK